jgi:DNA modification methylase
LIKNIPDNTIDLIIIDPPYEKKGGGYNRGGGAFGSQNRIYHSQLDDKELLKGITNDILDELCRVMKKVNIYIWCNKEQLRQYIDYFENKGCNTDLLTWHKTNPVPTCNNKYLSDTEYILFFREKGVKVYGTYTTKKKYYVTPTNKEDKKLYNHPTIKPLNIIENLIVNSSKENDVVLDCFMGSGTTAIGCIKNNRRYIGFEIDEDYYKIAQNRILDYELSV